MVGKTDPVVSVPLAAIGVKDGKRLVWIVNSLRRIRAQFVEVGRSNPDRVEITKGLSSGERICAVAEPFFRDGMRVQLFE